MLLDASNRAPAPGHRTGSTIAASFGLVYIEVNAGSLPASLALALRVLGAVAFLFVLFSLRGPGSEPVAVPELDGPGFGRRYWLIVGLEVAAIVGGSLVMDAVGLGWATVAWVSVVVGVHFFPLAAIWELTLLRPLGAAIALCGAIAIIAAAAGAGSGWVAGIGGVLPGGLLIWAAADRDGWRARLAGHVEIESSHAGDGRPEAGSGSGNAPRSTSALRAGAGVRASRRG